jgi:hypothetical protein
MAAIGRLDENDRAAWELHIVGHSAGCIYASYSLSELRNLRVPLRSIQLMAPAIRVDEFKKSFLGPIGDGICPVPTLYILSDVGERDDDVGPYGKSLLYLVSNAFEGQQQTPLLGMESFVTRDAEVRELFSRTVDGLPSLVVAGIEGGDGSTSRSDSHGGFDNDPATLNSVLFRILGEPPKRAFTTRDLQ